MSQLVRLRGTQTAQTAHCAVEERWQRMVHFAQTGNHEENQEEGAV